MSILQNALFTALALAAGSSFVFQQAVNANLSREIGSAWGAGFISYLGGTIVMLIMALFMRDSFLTSGFMARCSWWSWSGGLFGAVYIAISILLLPRIGAATVVILIVVGQLITSLFLEHFAFLNVPQHPISMTRVAGAVLLMAGAVLIRA